MVPSQLCAYETPVAEPMVLMYPEKAAASGTLARLPLHPQHSIELFNEDKLLRCRYVAALSWSFLVLF